LIQLENESLNKNGMEMMSATVCYKNTVDRMAKHIVYGNIIFFNSKLLMIKISRNLKIIASCILFMVVFPIFCYVNVLLS